MFCLLSESDCFPVIEDGVFDLVHFGTGASQGSHQEDDEHPEKDEEPDDVPGADAFDGFQEVTYYFHRLGYSAF